jgi:hypothetical protein
MFRKLGTPYSDAAHFPSALWRNSCTLTWKLKFPVAPRTCLVEGDEDFKANNPQAIQIVRRTSGSAGRRRIGQPDANKNEYKLPHAYGDGRARLAKSWKRRRCTSCRALPQKDGLERPWCGEHRIQQFKSPIRSHECSNQRICVQELRENNI